MYDRKNSDDGNDGYSDNYDGGNFDDNDDENYKTNNIQVWLILSKKVPFFLVKKGQQISFRQCPKVNIFFC